MAPLYLWPELDASAIIQTQQVPLPLLSIGKTDVVVTWPAPFATPPTISTMIEQGAVSIGSVVVALKLGTNTPAGCTMTLTNSALVSVAAGSVLHLTGVG